jgi:hypothetical protein
MLLPSCIKSGVPHSAQNPRSAQADDLKNFGSPHGNRKNLSRRNVPTKQVSLGFFRHRPREASLPPGSDAAGTAAVTLSGEIYYPNATTRWEAAITRRTVFRTASTRRPDFSIW